MRMPAAKHGLVGRPVRDKPPSDLLEPLEPRLLLSATAPLDSLLALVQWDGQTLPAIRGEWIGKVSDGLTPTRDVFASAIANTSGSPSTFEALGSPDLVLFRDLLITPEESFALAATLGLEYLEPNFIYYTSDVLESTFPSDPQFNSLWGLHNTGQSGGTLDADIDAPEAWDITIGLSSVVIAVIDSGIDYTHADLAANIWRNAGEIPGDGVDNDGNGYVDDVHGWDFAYGDSDPMDVDGHGTHVAGTIGGVGNNSMGVVGVNWNIQLMVLRFLDDDGYGTTWDAIAAVNYATMMKRDYGVNVVASNNSWGSGGYSTALRDAIAVAGNEGILFVAAAGNGGPDGIGDNNDVTPHYPSNYDLANIISVAATNRNDQLAGFSNYGAVSVDLAAPGVSILSTLPGGTYGSYSGTSMATPHVSGVVGLLAAANPSANAADIKSAIMAGVDPLLGLAGRCVTEGRLNAMAALQSVAPLPTVTVEVIDGQASETVPALPQDTATCEVKRTGNTGSLLTVYYIVSGTAVNGADYEYLFGTLTIPPGSSHATIVVTPIDDAEVEPNETIAVSLLANADYVLGSQREAWATLADNDVYLPTVSFVVDDSDARETAPGDATDPAIVTVVRSGDTSAELTVSYELGGTALNGMDYVPLPGTVTIPAGSDRASIVVHPIDDLEAEPTESVVLTVLPVTSYIVGNPATATLSIRDNDVATELQVELRVVAVPLPGDRMSDLAFAAYPSVAAVPAGSPYFAEVWLRDVGMTTTGLVGGRVDVVYTGGMVGCAGLHHGSVFISATSGQEEPGVGLVDNFGGATSAMGEGASEWVRLGYLEMEPLSGGYAQFQLQQGNVQFGQMSSGNIPWALVSFGPPVVIQQAGGEVDVWLVPRVQPSVADTSGVSPTPDRLPFWQLEGNDYYVEVWIRSDQIQAAAISGGSVNVTFDSQYAQAVGPLDHGSVFAVLPVDNINNTSGVVSIGGSTLATDMGDNEYVCLGRIKFQGTAPVDEVAHQVGPYDMNLDVASGSSVFSFVGGGNVTADFQTAPSVDVRAMTYDIDDSGLVDYGDFSYFAPAFLGVPGEPEPPYAWWADFDKSGWVDFGDFSYFVTAFMKPFADPGIVFPIGGARTLSTAWVAEVDDLESDVVCRWPNSQEEPSVGTDTLRLSLHAGEAFPPWWPPAVGISPPEPSASDAVWVTLYGDWPDMAVPGELAGHPSVQRVGFDIYVAAYYYVGITLPVVTPWSMTVSCGVLPGGEYNVFASLYGWATPSSGVWLENGPDLVSAFNVASSGNTTVDVWLVPRVEKTTPNGDILQTLPTDDREGPFWQVEDNALPHSPHYPPYPQWTTPDHRYGEYWVEVWVRSDQVQAVAISGGSVKVTFNPQYAEALAVEHGSIFTTLPVENINNPAGEVSLGGGTLATEMGDNEYVLLGRIKFRGKAPVNEAMHQYGPYDMNLGVAAGPTSFALVGMGNVSAEFKPAPTVDIWAMIYDIDDSGLVDFGDFSYFVPAFLQTVGGAEPPYKWWADFDHSGLVDFGDFSYFVTAFGKPFCDPSIQYPPWWWSTYVPHAGSQAGLEGHSLAMLVTATQPGSQVSNFSANQAKPSHPAKADIQSVGSLAEGRARGVGRAAIGTPSRAPWSPILNGAAIQVELTQPAETDLLSVSSQAGGRRGAVHLAAAGGSSLAPVTRIVRTPKARTTAVAVAPTEPSVLVLDLLPSLEIDGLAIPARWQGHS